MKFFATCHGLCCCHYFCFKGLFLTTLDLPYTSTLHYLLQRLFFFSPLTLIHIQLLLSTSYKKNQVGHRDFLYLGSTDSNKYNTNPKNSRPQFLFIKNSNFQSISPIMYLSKLNSYLFFKGKMYRKFLICCIRTFASLHIS